MGKQKENSLETIIAIDPGKNGGIAVFDVVRRKIVSLVKMPDTPTDILNFLSVYNTNSVCYLEKVGGLPGMGGSAMFNFGKGYGHIEMALLANKIKTCLLYTSYNAQIKNRIGRCYNVPQLRL